MYISGYARGFKTKQRGQALAEYVIGAAFLTIVVWYALVGGTKNQLTGKGGLYETDTVPVSGAYLKDDNSTAPGLIQALHKKQVTFQDDIYNQ